MQPCLVQSEFIKLKECSYLLTFVRLLISICSKERRLVWYKTLELYHLTQIQHLPFRVWKSPPSTQFSRQRDGSSSSFREDMSNKSQKQNQERARPLNKLSAIDPFLSSQSPYDSCRVKKKHPYTSPFHILASLQKVGYEVKDIFPNSYVNFVILFKNNMTRVYNNDGILDFEHKSRFFMTSWDADSLRCKFSYLFTFFVGSASLLFINRGKKQCNGRNHLEAIYKNRRKKILPRGKYIIRLQEKLGKKGETVYRRKTGKKETPGITVGGDFCPPSKISYQGYFSISYLFPLHTIVPIFPNPISLSFPKMHTISPLSQIHIFSPIQTIL